MYIRHDSDHVTRPLIRIRYAREFTMYQHNYSRFNARIRLTFALSRAFFFLSTLIWQAENAALEYMPASTDKNPALVASIRAAKNRSFNADSLRHIGLHINRGPTHSPTIEVRPNESFTD